MAVALMTAASKKPAAAPRKSKTPGIAKRLARYGCGPVPITGADHAFYERHLVFDNVMAPEAVARSIRDILSQRWLRTEETYRRIFYHTLFHNNLYSH
jgi:glycogen phosphorylase